MRIKTKTIMFLIVLCIIDMVVPIPILGIVLIYVVLQRPPWFADMARKICSAEENGKN